MSDAEEEDRPKQLTTDELKPLLVALAKELQQKIEKGNATAADLAVARQLLKDSGIQAVSGTTGSSLEQLMGPVDDSEAPTGRLAITAQDDFR